MKTNFLHNSLLTLTIISNNIFGICNQSNQTSRDPEVLKTIQGSWVLFQNPKQNLKIKMDTVDHYFNGILENRSLIRISNSVISKIFEEDTIKGSKEQFFFEELNVNSKEVEFQYSIISYSKNKFVLSPLHSGQLLTYDRKK